MIISSDFLHNSLRNYLRQSLRQTEKERCTKEGQTRQMIYSLTHNIAARTDYLLGRSRNEQQRRWQAGLAEERGAHTQTPLADGLIFHEKLRTFFLAFGTAHRGFCCFPCQSPEIPVNKTRVCSMP